MSTVLAIVIILIVLAVIVFAVLITRRKQRSESLQQRFGPEYDRTVESAGSRSKAEEDLAKRQERVEELQLRPLTSDQQQEFGDRWRDVQAQFVDDPPVSVAAADALIQEVMQARGYPVGDFEARAADISVHHAGVVENYRRAHEIALRQEQGQANTEDLRNAMVSYRSLFEDLLETLQSTS